VSQGKKVVVVMPAYNAERTTRKTHAEVANRFLTAVENVVLGAKLSEYHTGYRAFSAELLRCRPLASTSLTPLAGCSGALGSTPSNSSYTQRTLSLRPRYMATPAQTS
jgi:hypothetical protein